ncbi:MAG: hypothetical protein COV08_01735 [Candidatus Vogelbacteria bacterium CG10_big_fil_rev_8_21_14_0_10_49_38]|uniref:DUF4015 domain-containing protein n=1 Tax=Candidatus Vogelbacteria bacterium CG10_big_fil_rev_8_21_14_0_10_49_38 TaxID=1975043 RepID=A0A2H0RHW5_9BACT|nr:MAG: hypothetical protein BK006_01750 [bacterium CG10_49_38]PIR46119.1 MAG: hypothetical protein COV08_01735 [Candidatus Vogelbacteria bacterium CG10_big_fil_rev_8_21_14_0_10_49_38]
MKSRPRHQTLVVLVVGLVLLVVVGVLALLSFNVFGLGAMEYSRSEPLATTSVEAVPLKPAVTHLSTPVPVRAVYLSSWVAGTPSFREGLIKKLKGTEINAVVIDVKDYSGKIIVKLDEPEAAKYGSFENRAPDIAEFIAELHEKGFYVIGRISVFQDDFLARHRSDLALLRKDGRLWEDKKGVAWLDLSMPEVWEYIALIAKESHGVGFDELNFDYIRFPSDGDTTKISYRNYDATTETRPEALRDFFSYLQGQMKDLGAPTSADVFGMITTNTDDLGIGQVLEVVAPYFDYVAPMVYPSHYPPTWNGFVKPAQNPYEVVKIALEGAVVRLEAQGLPRSKLRPWLQDFDLGAVYTAQMVKAQHRAVYDNGLDSWMMWDPKNLYTMGAYQKIEN